MAAKATENKKEKSLVIVESPAKSKTIRKIGQIITEMPKSSFVRMMTAMYQREL